VALKVESQVWVIDFADDPDLAGLHLRVREPGLASAEAMSRLGGLSDSPDLTADDLRIVSSLVDSLAEVLIGWDLELDGAAVPPTGPGLRSLPLDVAAAVAVGWLRAVLQRSIEVAAGPETQEDDADAEVLASMPMQVAGPVEG
jgi:hypothetical protein